MVALRPLRPDVGPTGSWGFTPQNGKYLRVEWFLAIALGMRVADFEDVDLTIANFRRCWNFSNKKPGQLSFQRLFPLLSAPIVQPVSGKSVEKSYHQVMRN